MENFERDMGEWHRLSSSDSTPSVEKEIKCLVAQMQKAHMETQEAAEAISLDLKFLEARKVEIGDAIDASNNALLDVEDKIKKAKEMIKRANLFLSKAELVCLKEIAWLEQVNARTMKFSGRRRRRGQLWQRSKLACPKWRTSIKLS